MAVFRAPTQELPEPRERLDLVTYPAFWDRVPLRPGVSLPACLTKPTRPKNWLLTVPIIHAQEVYAHVIPADGADAAQLVGDLYRKSKKA